MSDIRKRVGRKGTTYQVRYPSKSSKTGYAYATFSTLKEARNFVESGGTRANQSVRQCEIKTVGQAVDKWLAICVKEGRDGRDPITRHTEKTYGRRAEVMKAYEWGKALQELQAPDIVEFRSWLLSRHSRYQAHKVLSSFHSVMKEMALRGHIASNVAAGISIRADSRYDEPVVIPTPADVQALLAAADRLANSKNKQTARTWERYRPMLYLAADTGMRPQEYLVIQPFNITEEGAKVDRALEGGGYKLSVPKTAAGRRTIEISPQTRELVTHYRDHKMIPNKFDLLFPTSTGRWQSIDNWRKRGFYAVCCEAGLMKTVEEDGETVERPKYKPYDLRHFYASMLIERRTNLKKIQKLMGHEDIKTTLNIYGHLIEAAETRDDSSVGLLSILTARNSCGESVASPL
ncbi:tyrosine-type recombinase/integrase [Amphiplicatus metriothermophilus]|uniref:Site-specific recombinase XerD n=1 Tax=Amphiplicatus metriothermophilus TaxID=1519374 RepID=A0A239PZB3_9PROT|nr:site-specific integrase [Amphiplicatus metriothermophilus]SNT75689.1 Site-specific recombinase XerD [Amphiplicatus metriothermophilus]